MSSGGATLEGLLEGFAYGRGFQETLRPADPSAGATLTVPIPGDYETRLLVVRFTFVTGAAVADRIVTVDYLDQDGVIFDSNGFATAILASTTVAITGQLDRSQSDFGTTAAGTVLPIFFPVNNLFLEPGYSIKINVTNIQAADQISTARLTVERFPTGRGGYPEGMIRHRGRARR